MIRRLRALVPDGWTLLAALVAGALLLPILSLGGELLVGLGEPVKLGGPRLWRYLRHTGLLVAGVGLFAAVAGTGTAWLVTAYRFPGRDALGWALVLPLALPAYIAAYSYAGLSGFGGPLHALLQRVSGESAIATARWLPYEQVTTLAGLVVVMGAVLYPYVYLICRASFRLQSATLIEAAQLFGQRRGRVFFSVALPLARPAIVAGTGLVLMETLNEFGAPQFFGVDTLCTAIVYGWEQDEHPGRALRLAALLVSIVALVVVVERLQRGRQAYVRRQMERTLTPLPLRGGLAWAATAACLTPVALGFLLPVGQLVWWASGGRWEADFGRMALNSFGLAASAAAVTTALALLLVYAARVARGPATRAIGRAAALGYAVPGAAIALGALMLSLRVDRWLSADRLILAGSLAALVWAYATRFVAVAFGAIDSGFERIGHQVEEAARSLGAGPWRVLWRVSLPLVRGSVLAAAVLVFVDVLKELPLTLLMQPFDFDTLALRTYFRASDERLSQAAWPALVIVGLGLGPVAIAHRLTR